MFNQKKYEDLIKKAKQNPDDSSIKQHILANLTPDERNKLSKMLSDRATLEKILNTPEAKELMRKFNEDGKKNG